MYHLNVSFSEKRGSQCAKDSSQRGDNCPSTNYFKTCVTGTVDTCTCATTYSKEFGTTYCYKDSGQY